MVADESTFRKGGQTSPIKNSYRAGKVAKTKAGFTTSNRVEKIMEEFRDTKWHVDLTAIKRIINEDNRESLLKWLGYTEDTNLMSEYDATGQISKNRDILKSIEELERVASENDADAMEMYFDWFYSSNGRYMMDSNTLNPQTDKLHRFLIQPKATLLSYTKDKKGNVLHEGKDVTNLFDYALAQAFGFAVDKKLSTQVFAIGKALRGMKPADLEAKLNAGEDVVITVDGKEVELEPDHISHAYQAIAALEGYQSGKEFSSAMTAETDAVTSGFALKLMQIPVLGEAIFTWLNKVGVFREKDLKGLDKDGKSMNDILSQEGFFDSYQTLAKETVITKDGIQEGFEKLRKPKFRYDDTVWEPLSAVLPSFDGTEVSGELRTLFKDPFMTFNYSAGMASIRRSLANLLEMLAKRTGKTPTALKKALATRPLYTLKTVEGESVEVLLNEFIDASYGYKVESIMTDNFQPFIEAQKNINNSFKVMFSLFNKEYQEELAKINKDTSKVTDADKLVIIDKLRHKFPAIKGPLSDKADKSDYIGIYKTKNATPSSTENRLKPTQTYLAGGKSDKVRHEIKVFEEAVSAGAVVPIHYIDGALMGILNEEFSGQFTAIHDAIMMPLTEMASGAKRYNELYMEVGMEYSVIAEIQAQLESAIKDTDLTAEYFQEVHTKGEKGDPDITYGDFITDTIVEFGKLNDTVKVARAELKRELDQGSYIAHMASIEEGVHYHKDSAIMSDKIDSNISPEALAKAKKVLEEARKDCK